jgi:hypothetical protein
MNLIHAVNTLDILPDDTLNLCCKSINKNPNLSRIMTIRNSSIKRSVLDDTLFVISLLSISILSAPCCTILE